ncbi:2'-5' RNA ligase family protein [Pedobacter gandavensis]|uniref:2'-5' RNA ligase family protein n=1 Tax=Pedobacter gandavensis TaxID=2679963 RepID=A0ABR6EWA4_9SPHI|nr:2'-5' RNA ligase family protein [Pedobacter gandavensis]MBB2149552.1 hypothetical protein [Pedobacter gandavensis]
MKHRYLIAILPPKELAIEIDNIRQLCSHRFNVFKALRPPVHITLRYIDELEESYEPKLITSLSAARNFKPFIQHLHNFSGFQKAKAIYVAATANKQIDNLYTQIINHTKPFCKNASGGRTPHITIAYRDVTPDLYLEIMEYYKKQTFQADFEVNQFSLLKHDGIRWNVLKHYHSLPGSEQLQIPL